MSDTTEVTFTKQKVFHDGTSMVVVKAGETKAVPVGMIGQFVAEGAIVTEGTVPASAGTAAGDPLDRDGDGEPGGSLPASPPALTGRNKAGLLEIAAEEGVETEEGATNAEIVEAIEAKRAEPVEIADGAEEAPPA